VESNGILYVTDCLSHAIRKITPDGQVSTFAGTGEPGTIDGTGTAALFELPNRVTIDKQDNLYFTEGRFLDLAERTYGFRVRKIMPDAGVTTLAGTGDPGYRDGPALDAEFDVPIGIDVDTEGNLYVVDSGTHRFRQCGFHRRRQRQCWLRRRTRGRSRVLVSHEHCRWSYRAAIRSRLEEPPHPDHHRRVNTTPYLRRFENLPQLMPTSRRHRSG
jgi:hypothetical protein